MRKLVFGILYLSLCWNILNAQVTADSVQISTKEENILEQRWIDSLYNRMSPDERIGQLIMIRAHSDKGPDHIAAVENLIQKYNVGGLCFFQGTPEKQAELTNHYQELTQFVPLLVAMDAEWGLSMRLKETAIAFPRQLMLGAIQDNTLIYEMGREIARECRRLGVHINFAPVADVNNNPNNPVINDRSFGEDRYNVAAKSYMYMLGMQDGKVMACAKHFPGHGDTDVDSHLDLPLIPHSMERLDSVELMPFKVLSQYGIQSMMIAHLQVPSIDSTAHLPSTLSKNTVTDLLKNKIGFDGLIMTDALEMKGVTKYYGEGEVEARALAAGNDMLLLPESVPNAISKIKEFIAQGLIDTLQIEKSVKKVLGAKYRLGLNNYQPVVTFNLREDLNTPQARILKRKLIENALTLVRNKDNLLPFANLDTLRMASLSIGSSGKTVFQQTLSNYQPMKQFDVDNFVTEAKSKELIDQLREMNVVVVSLQGMSRAAERNYGLTDSAISLILNLNKVTKVVLVVFGNPYALKYFDDIDYVMEAYNDESMTQDAAAQAAFGAFMISGRLPVTASPRSAKDMGMVSPDLHRLRFDIPERVGMNSDVLDRIGCIADEAISKGATPGCQILIAKDGYVVYQKSFGYHTYDKSLPVSNDDVFDLASITKIIASTLSMMKLADEQKVNLLAPIGQYMPQLSGTNKAPLIIRDIMAHQAGLQAWIPFYKKTVQFDGRENCPMPEYYCDVNNGAFCVPVCRNLYMRADYEDTLRQEIWKSDLRGSTDYKYSDLGFYLMADLIRQVSGQRIDTFAETHFYQPLGMGSTTYNPWQRIPDSLIIPTEEDHYFRMQRVQGYVHDMGAAMMGGVSGHAGLFSKTNDLAIVGQLLLNKGVYGGQRYFSEETVKQFTTRVPGSTRRGIGFDMKETGTGKTQNVSAKAPASTFGHTGFTGNCIWIDPDNNLIFIFLSNRTYPTMENNRLINGDFRPRIQSVVYEALQQ